MLLLVAGYFVYGALVEKVFGVNPGRQTPAYASTDGIDYIPMPTWKVFLIQFLNIAGLGPIFGAIMGILYGPSAYLWIVFGTIFGGAVHDYLSGMLSVRRNGASLPELVGDELGSGVKQVMRIFSLLLMILVRAAVPAMKKANPDCVILAGSVSNMWSESYKWMSYCFADGMLDIHWDIWSVHPYGVKAPEDYMEAYSHTRNLMKKAGGDTGRLWINSERGFPLGKAEGYAGGDPSLAYEYQAWHVIRQYLVDLLEGLPVTIWYEWGGKEGFALYRAGNMTPAYNACKTFVKELSGYKLDCRMKTENKRDFLLRFIDKNGNEKLVAWTAPGVMESPDKIVPHSIRIAVGDVSPRLVSTDLYGRTDIVEVSKGVIELCLTGAPVYITLR